MSVIGHWIAKRGGMKAIAETREYAATLVSEGWTVEGPFVLASTTEGAVKDRDDLRLMLGRLLEVALVDGYGETVADEAHALLDTIGGQ